MKKLMTILASAATALFAIGSASADDWTISTSVEEVAPGVLDTLNTTEGNNKYYWFLKDANDATGLIVTNYEGGASVNPADVSRPDVFEDAINTNYLAIDISDRLYRKVGGENQGALDAGVTIPENGIYLDTLVMFTAAEEEFDANALGDGDKIAIEYVEREVEEDNVTTTQRCFVVRAGYIGSEQVDATNYVGYLESMDSFDKSKWHRLTVRTIPSIDADNHVGFVVYVDEEPIKYDTNVAAGDDFTATGAALAFYDSNTHALFPSAVNTDENNYNTIAAAAFSGTGAIDDVVLTSETPNFITASEQIPATITLGTGIASVTVTVGEDEINPVDGTATPLVYNLPAGTTSFNLAVTADTANGYTFDDIDGAAYDNGVVTWSGAAPTFTVLATRDNVFYMNGETKVGFAKLSDAFANAPADTTLKLAYDYAVADNETTTPTAPVFTIGKNLVLDLNGKTLDGGSSNYRLMFSVAQDCVFTVIDSVVGDAGSITYGGTYGIFGGDGDIYLGSTTLTDYGPVIEGWLLGDLDTGNGFVTSIIRGKFSAADNTVSGSDDFDAGTAVDLNSDYSLIGNYWVVAPKGEEPPVTFALTLPDVTGATAAVTAGGSAVANIAAIVSNTEVVVTWTATDGYKITSGATETITMDSDKQAAAPTVVAITYATLTITPVENCTIVVSNATEEVATGAKFDVADEVQLTVYRTPAEGYELVNCDATETITMNQDQTVTATVTQVVPETWTVTITLSNHVTSVSYVFVDTPETTNTLSATGSFTIEKGKSFAVVDATPDEGWEIDFEASMATIDGATIDPTYYTIMPTNNASATVIAKATGGSTYPSYIEDATEQAKYDTWKAAMAIAGVDVGDGEDYEDAYLLNCTPAEVDAEKAAFKLNITIDGTTVTVTTPDGKSYNGTVQLKGSNDLSTWTNVESASSSYKFYKAELQ